jgi:hypothetical protein
VIIATPRDLEPPLDRLIRVGHAAHDQHLGLPQPRRELLSQQLGRILLDEDLGFEVEARREVEVFVEGTSVAVVANSAIGNEISRAGRDVIEPHLPDRLDRYHPEIRLALQRLAFNACLPADCRFHGVKEAQVLFQPAP